MPKETNKNLNLNTTNQETNVASSSEIKGKNKEIINVSESLDLIIKDSENLNQQLSTDLISESGKNLVEIVGETK
jgi:hypothetical protein